MDKKTFLLYTGGNTTSLGMNKNKLEGKREHTPFAQPRKAFTLVEVIVAIAVFAILLLTVIGISQQIHNLATTSKLKTTAATIAQEQVELVRNLPYSSIGSDVTYPTGPLLSSQTISRNGGNFTVKIVIKDIDDPADGLSPADTVPLDYKQVEIQVCWNTSSCNNPVRLSTYVVPKTLEYANNAGAMFIAVIDANAQPVSGATIHVTNTTPAVDVTNQTDVNGKLQLLSLPAAANSYRVTASKNGYSGDGTVAVSGTNPAPYNPDPSVINGNKTDVILQIDKVSTLVVHALDQTTCAGLGSVTVRITGSQRLIGLNPNIPAYDKTFVTDAAGQFLITNLPWDNYSFAISSAGDDVAGVTPPDSIIVNPASSVTGSIVLAAHQANTARIIVRATGTKAPVANATVTINNGGAYSAELITDQGILQQNNWIGGPGQAIYGDLAKYSANSGALDATAPNLLSIATQSSTPSVSEDFHTTNKQDAGNSATSDWQTGPGKIQLLPDSLNPGKFLTAGQAQSVKLNPADGQITAVTLTATSTIAAGQSVAYAVAADGITFEPVTPGLAHALAASGTDLRWRVTMATTDTTTTPSVSNLTLNYTQVTRPVVDGNLTSSTFDSGGPTNYTALSWEPSSQPVSAGSTPVRFQVAAAGSTVSNGGPTVDVASNPSTSPLFTKNIGDASNTTYLAQSFIAGTSDSIDSIDLKLAQHSAPTTTITAFIYNDSSNAPGDNLSGSGQDITATVLSDSSSTWQDTWLTQPFSPHTALVAGTKYWLVLSVSGSNSSKYWTTVRSQNDTTYNNGTAKTGSGLGNTCPTLGSLCPLNYDIAFQIRRSGVTETPITPAAFIGPDGTSNTYYTTSGSTVHASLNGLRYLRYKLFLHTDDQLVSPTISRVSIIKNNACTPPGQVFFSPLPAAGSYTVNVTAAGYQSASVPITVSGNTSQYVDLTPTP